MPGWPSTPPPTCVVLGAKASKSAPGKQPHPPVTTPAAAATAKLLAARHFPHKNAYNTHDTLAPTLTHHSSSRSSSGNDPTTCSPEHPSQWLDSYMALIWWVALQLVQRDCWLGCGRGPVAPRKAADRRPCCTCAPHGVDSALLFPIPAAKERLPSTGCMACMQVVRTSLAVSLLVVISGFNEELNE